MQLVAYTRVSRIGGRDIESESFITVKEQLRQIESYAQTYNHTILAHFSDLDESGGKIDRPEFEKALAMATNGADGLIVAKLDRFSRSVADALAILKELSDRGKQIVSVTDNVDTTTAMGRAMWQIVLVFAELERGRASENWRAALANAVGRGVHVASRTPTGYRRREDKRLEPDPVAAPVVKELFLRRARGAGWSELARLLNESGVVGPYSAANWTHTAVANLVRNRVYVGEARNGQHVNPTAHEAIVTEAEWQAANAPKAPRVSPPRATDTLLTGLIRCAGCRYQLKADKLNNRGAEKLRVYRCRGSHASGRCGEKAYVMARIIEPYVERQFLAALEPGGLLAEATASSAALDRAQRDLDEAQTELEVYVETTRAASVGGDVFRRGLERRQQAVDEATGALAELRRHQPIEGLAALAARWDELDVAERRSLLAAGIDAVFVRQGQAGKGTPIEGRAKILWRGDAPSDLPKRGARPALKPYTW